MEPPSRLRHWLRTLHLWIGLSAGVAFAVFGISGTVLTYQPELLRWQHPELFAQPAPDDATIALGLARLAAAPPPGVSGGDLPRAATPYWQLFTADAGRLYMDAGASRVLLERTTDNDWVLWLRDLHTHLLGGHTGEEVAGVLGLLCLFLLGSGIYLWWPRLGSWWPHLRWFAQPPVRRWLSWHRSLGTLTLPLLLLVTVTGVAMIYSGGVRVLLGAVLPDAPDPIPPAMLSAGHPSPTGRAVGGEGPHPQGAGAARASTTTDWNTLLGNARAALPDADLARVSFPRNGEPRLVFRARSRGEWHPVGRSLVWMDTASASALGASDATALSPASRASHAVYPLHMGAVGGPLYRHAVALSGLLPVFLLVTGTLLWLRRRAARR